MICKVFLYLGCYDKKLFIHLLDFWCLTNAGRPLGDFGIGPYQKDENRPQNRTQIGPKIGLIFYKTLKIGPILKKTVPFRTNTIYVQKNH